MGIQVESGLYSTWDVVLVKAAVTIFLTLVKLLALDFVFMLLLFCLYF